jgi:uncharacterized protein
VNVVSGPQFGPTGRRPCAGRPLNGPRKTRASGRVLAETLGARLGPLRQITASSTGYQPPALPYTMAKAAVASLSDAAQTYQAEQIEITAQLTAKFELLIE